MTPEVVVTGYGAVTPLSLNAEDSWNALLHGESGVSEITRFDTESFPVKFAGEISDFDATEYISKKQTKRMDRFAQFGFAAASEAIERSAIHESSVNTDDVGVISGSGIGGIGEMEEQQERLLNKGPDRISPFYIPKLMMNAVPGHISMEYGFQGANFAVASACASGNNAIETAAEYIRSGKIKAAVTGGVESALTPSSLGGFCSLRALSKRNDEPKKASRPFDDDRDGFVLGEGAGFLILETLEHAKNRDATIFARYLGGAATSDAYHITAPEPDGKGAEKAITQALKDADRSPEDVSYINAHGTSTPKNDPIETKAIRNALGSAADDVPVSSTKSMIGHSLGASAGIEAVMCVLSLRDQMIHPTINYENPDPECDLDYVPNEARELQLETVLSNSFGFGGHSTALVFGKA